MRKFQFRKQLLLTASALLLAVVGVQAVTIEPVPGFSYIGKTYTFSTSDDDPVVLTINGVPVTRSEFEYAYNKNRDIEGAVEQKSVREFAEMYVDYRLKVAAALDARLDTVAAFRQEFRANRDMQLTPFLVDTVFIDSIARLQYKQIETALAGQDMLRVAHILVPVPQNAPADVAEAAKQKADSLHAVLKAGADFAEIAKRHSSDPGSARQGGLLPWIGPNSTVKEFETTAYALQKGEMSQPVLTQFGYHIILMKERKALESFETLRPQLIQALKRQGIEEASMEHRINQLVAASNGSLTREQVIENVMREEVDGRPELKYLIKEYHDGSLAFEVTKLKVLDPAAKDADALAAYYKKNKKNYQWDEPRFKGFVILLKDPSQKKAVQKILKKHADGDWRAELKKTINRDSTQVFVTGPYLAKQGENRYIDFAVFGKGDVKGPARFPIVETYGKLLKKPSSYLDVKSLVISDYQDVMMKAWLEELRAKYKVEIHEDVLATVNNH